MMRSFSEPTLAELLNDPVTHALMQADDVNPWELKETLHYVARLRRVRVKAITVPQKKKTHEPREEIDRTVGLFDQASTDL
jgi:hypothetical protein